MGRLTNLRRRGLLVDSKRTLISPTMLATKSWKREKEKPMNGLEVMIGMTILRVILPVSMLLAIGEWVSRHRHPRSYRR